MENRIVVDFNALDRIAKQLNNAGSELDAAMSILSGTHPTRAGGAYLRLSGADIALRSVGGMVGASNVAQVVTSYRGALGRLENHSHSLSLAVCQVSASFRSNETGIGRGQNAGERAPTNSGGSGSGASDADARREREERAKAIKIATGVLCFVASIAVVVATGGAALPVVVAGATTGAIAAGVNSGADQYAEKGWDDIDWSEAGKEAVIGGIVGGVTGAVTAGGGAVANKVVGEVVSGTTTAAGRLAAHTAGGAVSSVVTGVASRAGGEATSEWMRNGEVDWSRVRDRAFDPYSMVTDGAIGGTVGFVQGRQYNKSYDQVRKESYIQREPYKKNYGKIDWNGQVGDGMDHSQPILHDYEIPKDTYVRRTGPDSGNYLRNIEDSFDSASLPYRYYPSSEHCYRVLKPIPGTTKSIARSGFDMPGGATQYQTNQSIEQLIRDGYLLKIY